MSAATQQIRYCTSPDGVRVAYAVSEQIQWLNELTRRIHLLVLVLAILPAASSSHAQDAQLSHSEYLEATGMIQQAADLEQWLRDQLEAQYPEWTIDRRHQNAAFFAFVFTVSGMTAEAAAALQAQGVDVIHGITANARPFIEQALLTDLVVVGDIVRSEASGEPNDGFGWSDVVEIRRVLKGDARGGQIILRRRDRGRERDVIPVVGRRYLLLLSNGMYEFAAAGHRAAISADPDGPYYSIYRIYQIDDGRLLWQNFDRERTARAFEEIQLLDELLDAAARLERPD